VLDTKAANSGTVAVRILGSDANYDRAVGCLLLQRLSRAVNDKLGIEPECGS